MEGGYVNEGGQLKTKNGQKYVFNTSPSGVFVSKTCAIFSIILAVLIITFIILITYFITVGTMKAYNCQNSSSISVNYYNEFHGTGIATTPSKNVSDVLNFLRTTKPGENDASLTSIHSTMGAENDILNNEDFQLYEGWTPEHYIIIIEPNIETSSNNGSLSVEIRPDLQVPELRPIVFDVHNISISNVSVKRTKLVKDDKVDLDFDSYYGTRNSTFVIIIKSKYNDVVLHGTDTLLIVSLDFVSQLSDTLQGVYKTCYTNIAKECMISTQFSPIDARRAFPCFDRPDKKANFTISIIRDNNHTMALSNMPVYHSSIYRPGYTRDDFMTTPKMPTYLVAFVISNFVKSNYSDIYADTVPRVEIWTRPESKDMTNYAYKMVRKFLSFFEEYFGIKNRLSKIDLVSMPEFGFGAMENWGLLTFRESALLVPDDLEKASSSEHIEYVAQIIAHEIAHQWFGNLVTPKWWDDLWLKEGFACYMSYITLNAVHPEYQIMDTLTVVEFKESMQHDVDNSAHAISIDVKSTNNIRRIFDPITYSKGTILLRMLNSIIGDGAFRGAVKDFLQHYAYQNADHNNLWKFMSYHGHSVKTLTSDVEVKDIMKSWISQAGYPVVNVERRGTNLLLKQERYILGSEKKSNQKKWMIPITFETDEVKTNVRHNIFWMTPQNEEVEIKDVFKSSNNTENVVYLNLNRQGYYRVNYDKISWVALKKKFASLPRVTRAQLLDDALHLAQGEYLTYDIPLTFLLEMVTSKDDELLWSAAQQGITYLTHMLQREPAYGVFKAFMRFIVRSAFKYYGLEEPDNESHLELQHRARVVHLACKFGYDRCIYRAHSIYREWMKDPISNSIKPNLKPIIYCTALAAEQFSMREWYFAYNQYKQTTSASEKEQILAALGCTNIPALLAEYLNMTFSTTSTIKKQDGVRAFRAVAENPIGFDIAFGFLYDNIEEIVDYFGDGFSTITDMIKSLTSYMNHEHHKELLQKFAEKVRKLGFLSVESSINLAIEKVNNNIYWRQRSYYRIKEFLEIIVSEFHINLF